jgi:hypothetical protein
MSEELTMRPLTCSRRPLTARGSGMAVALLYLPCSFMHSLCMKLHVSLRKSLSCWLCQPIQQLCGARSMRSRRTRLATSLLRRLWRSATPTNRRSTTLATETGIASTVGCSACPTGPRAMRTATCSGACGVGAVVSHQSALVIYDLGDANPTRLHLTVPRGFRAEDASVVFHRAVLAPGDVEDRDGYQITSVQRTLFDVASGDMTQEQLDVAVADAVKRGLVTPRRLRHRADEFGPRAALRIERALAAFESESLC